MSPAAFPLHAAAAPNAALLQREEQLRAWMLAGLQGDARCHVALLRAIGPLLAGFFGRRAGADADDLVQEVLLAVHERGASYDPARPFLPWLFGIARHKLVDHFRRTRWHEPIDRLAEVLGEEGFAERSDARIDVTALLGALPPKQSRAIRDTRLRGLSVAEAAREQGIGESDVKVSAHRGIRTLRSLVAGSAAWTAT